jgi:hypothetical protein
LFIGFFFLTLNADKGSSFAYLIIFGGVVLIIMGIVNKLVWEDVIIETRGGMLLSYSVDENKAQTEVNKIEDARRARGLTI